MVSSRDLPSLSNSRKHGLISKKPRNDALGSKEVVVRVLTLHQGVGDRVDTVEDDSTYNQNVRTEVPEKPH